MNDAETAPPADAAPALRPADLTARILAENPFLDNRIHGPSTDDLDAESVHRTAFERLTTLAGEALRARRGLGAVLWGEAGVGKSHLLSRFARWAVSKACFVYLPPLQADPDQLPRCMLRATLGVLTRGQKRRFYRTPLFDLVHAGVVHAVGDLRFISWARLERGFAEWVDRLGQQDLPGSSLLDRDVFGVLFAFYRSAYRARLRREDGRTAALAVRWLSGQPLDPLEARAIGLTPGARRDEPTALCDASEIRQVLSALARMAVCKRQPLVLAFDQVDSLADDQTAALGRFLETLLDASPGMLAITTGVQSTLEGWRDRRLLRDSTWDRLAHIHVQLGRLTPAEAENIVAVRLAAFLAPFTHLDGIESRVVADPLFPLDCTWRRRGLDNRTALRARDIINSAREGWQALQERLRQNHDESWLVGDESNGRNGHKARLHGSNGMAELEELSRDTAEIPERRDMSPEIRTESVRS